MMDNTQIRQLMIQAIPSVDPTKLEVEMMNWDGIAGYWYRTDMGTLHGKAIALHKSEKEIAAELASDLSSLIVGETLGLSPYEGKVGRHPDDCTCSKHKGLNGQA